jgi:hypothetical protein
VQHFGYGKPTRRQFKSGWHRGVVGDGSRAGVLLPPVLCATESASVHFDRLGWCACSAVLAIVAGCRSSPAWFLFVALPVGFFLMTLNFEQPTQIELKNSTPNGTEFQLSGSGKLTELSVFSPEYATAAETVDDPKFALWSIHATGPMSSG